MGCYRSRLFGFGWCGIPPHDFAALLKERSTSSPEPDVVMCCALGGTAGRHPGSKRWRSIEKKRTLHVSIVIYPYKYHAKTYKYRVSMMYDTLWNINYHVDMQRKSLYCLLLFMLSKGISVRLKRGQDPPGALALASSVATWYGVCGMFSQGTR